MIEALCNLNVIGLVYDGLGVAILGIPSLVESAEDTHRESGTYWDSNEPLMQRLVRAKFDTSAGSVVLVLGFIMQLLATLGVGGTPLIVALLWALIVVLPLSYFFFWRRRLVASYIAAIKRIEAQAQK